MGKERSAQLKTILKIDGGAGHERGAASVWVCPECFDVYDGRPADGDCPSPGHAPVALFETPVRRVPSGDAAPAHGDRPVPIAA
jgi:hypothetical protein